MPTENLKPLLVSMKEAQRYIAVGRNKLWKLAKQGEIEIVGSETKRYAVVASLDAYVARMPRRQPAPADGEAA